MTVRELRDYCTALIEETAAENKEGGIEGDAGDFAVVLSADAEGNQFRMLGVPEDYKVEEHGPSRCIGVARCDFSGWNCVDQVGEDDPNSMILWPL